MSVPVDVSTDCLGALRRHGTHSSGFLALNEGNSYFRVPGLDGVQPYRVQGRTWVQFGGPICAPQHRRELLAAFLQEAKQRRRRVIGIQLSREDALLQAEFGFRANVFGASYSLDLSTFSLRGQKFVKTRNMITRARREGVQVVELGVDEPTGVPSTRALQQQLADLDRTWLRNKGWHTKQMRFLVGERSGEHHHLRRVFVALHEGQVDAYVTFSPVYGPQAGWLYDLTRRRPDAAKGAIELVFATAAERMQEAGAGWLHLGMTPFVELDEQNQLPGYHGGVASLMRLLNEHGESLYPAATQLAFKLKWRPGLITHEYVVFPGRPSLVATVALARAANIL